MASISSSFASADAMDLLRWQARRAPKRVAARCCCSRNSPPAQFAKTSRRWSRGRHLAAASARPAAVAWPAHCQFCCGLPRPAAGSPTSSSRATRAAGRCRCGSSRGACATSRRRRAPPPPPARRGCRRLQRAPRRESPRWPDADASVVGLIGADDSAGGAAAARAPLAASSPPPRGYRATPQRQRHGGGGNYEERRRRRRGRSAPASQSRDPRPPREHDRRDRQLLRRWSRWARQCSCCCWRRRARPARARRRDAMMGNISTCSRTAGTVRPRQSIDPYQMQRPDLDLPLPSADLAAPVRRPTETVGLMTQPSLLQLGEAAAAEARRAARRRGVGGGGVLTAAAARPRRPQRRARRRRRAAPTPTRARCTRAAWPRCRPRSASGSMR